jgi:transposase
MDVSVSFRVLSDLCKGINFRRCRAVLICTINAVCEQYAKSRRQRNRPFLRWRGRRSLGWVPLKGRDLKREGNAFRFAGNAFRVFHSRPLPEGKIKDGTNFSCDARGHWFLNIVVEVAAPEPLAKTRLAKSVLDAGWSSFRGMLRYKATAHGAWYEEVSELFSSRVCSSCAAKTGRGGCQRHGLIIA